MALATHVRVSALLQRCQQAGESVYVIARGDRDAGALLVKHAHLNGTATVLMRHYGMEGDPVWMPATGNGPMPEAEADAYLRLRRDSDGDLWIVEIESRREALPLTDI